MTDATTKGLTADGRIDWQSLTREEAGRLSEIHFSIRRERKHLREATRGTVDTEARRLGIKFSNYNKPELIEAILAKAFIADVEGELDKASAREVLS